MMDKTSENGRPAPPLEKRWKKGVTGNPRGRPRKQDSLTSLLKEEIEKICPADKESRTWGELIVRATLQLALKGNPVALREVWGGEVQRTYNFLTKTASIRFPSMSRTSKR